MKGRPTECEFSPEEREALRGLVAQYSSSVRRKRVALALEELPAHPACRPATARWIRERIARYRAEGKRVQWPESAYRAARITPGVAAAQRGPKALAMAAPHVRRGGYWVDAAGKERPLEALDIYESDDVSINEPFRWQDMESGLWLAGRQVLATCDVGSAGMLGATCVGRPRDAYRQEDIADHFADIIELWGLPRAWRLERGSWAATFVRGIEMEGMASRWGALDGLFAVVHTTGPRGKGLIEERFDMLQTFMAHRGGLTLGRHPGEFERAAQVMRRVNYDRRRGEEGLEAAQEAVMHLWTAVEAADGVREAMERMHARPVERTWAPGARAPRELLEAAGRRELPEAERWRLHPLKRAAVARGGCIEVRAPGHALPLRFCPPAELQLEDGHQVYVAFHPARPELGMAVANRQRGPKNRRAWGMGEMLCRAAEWVPLMPQVDLTTPSGAAGSGLGKRHAAAVRAEFRGVRRQMEAYRKLQDRRSEQRDGKGGRTEIGGVRRGPPKVQPRPQPRYVEDLVEETAERGRGGRREINFEDLVL